MLTFEVMQINALTAMMSLVYLRLKYEAAARRLVWLQQGEMTGLKLPRIQSVTVTD